MTKQVLAHQSHTVVFRSREGGILFDTPVTVDGAIYADPEFKDRINKAERVTNGAGEFTFYAKPGTVVTLAADSPIAGDTEPVQFVGVTERPGGLAAVHPKDTPDVHEQSPISEQVSDASLVGAPPDGDLDKVRVAEAQVIPPGDPAPGTPDGTTATDPDAAAPPAASEEQVTPQYEAVADPNATHLEPEQVTKVDPPGEQ
jgi:hypothetical protein